VGGGGGALALEGALALSKPNPRRATLPASRASYAAPGFRCRDRTFRVRWLSGQQPIPLHGCLNSIRSPLPRIVRTEDGVRIFHVIQRRFHDVEPKADRQECGE
jgi:hypothetical protein